MLRNILLNISTRLKLTFWIDGGYITVQSKSVVIIIVNSNTLRFPTHHMLSKQPWGPATRPTLHAGFLAGGVLRQISPPAELDYISLLVVRWCSACQQASGGSECEQNQDFIESANHSPDEGDPRACRARPGIPDRIQFISQGLLLHSPHWCLVLYCGREHSTFSDENSPGEKYFFGLQNGRSQFVWGYWQLGQYPSFYTSKPDSGLHMFLLNGTFSVTGLKLNVYPVSVTPTTLTIVRISRLGK